MTEYSIAKGSTRPSTASCIKVWLGILVAVSYILVVLFTLWMQKQREERETLRRLQLPNNRNKIPELRLQLELPNKDVFRVKANIEIEAKNSEEKQGSFEPMPRDYDVQLNRSLPETGKDLTQHRKHSIANESIINETNPKIILYPSENKTRFATFGFTTPNGEDYFYAFSAPLAVRAWKRIGYDSIVFVIGDINEWKTKEPLIHIYNELVALQPALIFLKSKPENEILLSQACRLFAFNFFSWKNPNETIIVTTDVDLWPLNAALFDIPKGKRVLSLNSECCGSFDHGSHIYKLLPLGNIVANVPTWKEIINVNGFYSRTVSEIIDYFFRDFGPLALERTRKDEYVGWYMDQRMISMRLSDWMAKYGGSNVEFVPRDPGRDRLDVNYWMPYSIHGKNDVHILPGAYKPGVWEKIRPLFKLMYSKDEEYEIVEYRETFMKYYINSKKYAER